MAQKVYHCHTPNSCFTLSNGRTLRFSGNYFATDEEEVQRELDPICGKSQISNADQEAETLHQELMRKQEADLLAKQLANATQSQLGETNALAAAVGGTVQQVPQGSIELAASEKAAQLLASRSK